jgi:uncharacterized protein
MIQGASDPGSEVKDRHVLILSDGKPGHVNQSVAFARLLGLSYEIRPVAFRRRICKALSYLYDRRGILTDTLFRIEGDVPECWAVVSAGSATYYANRVTARRMNARSIAIMLPQGYRYDFDLIVAQEHDCPPQRSNILSLPVNLSYVIPAGLVRPDPANRYVSLVVGGTNTEFKMEPEPLERAIVDIFERFPKHQILVATSRRTPEAVEKMLEQHPFAEKFFYSRNPANPIPDFLAFSEYAFITADSTSMISEAVTFGNSCVEVIPLKGRSKENKFLRMTAHLAELGCLHIYDGEVGACCAKINLSERLKEVQLCV